MSRSLDQVQVQRSFSLAANSYDEAAELQREIARRLLDLLELIPGPEPKRMLDLGAGTGEVTAWLRKRFRRSQLMAVDPAPGMLQHCRKRAGFFKSWACIGGRGEQIPLRDGSVDLLFSNVALQWCSEFALAAKEMHRCLNDQGRLLLSTFGPGTLWELRDSWASVSSATHVNEFDSLEQVGDSLHAAGFRDVVVESEVIQLLYPDAKALMRELKAIGAHNTNHGRPSGLTGRKRMQGMLEHYRQYRNKEGLWPASYEVVYATAGR